MAIVDIEIMDPKTGKPVTIKNRLFLHTRTEWTIGQFFTSIGLKRKGEAFRPNWNAIAGKTGTLKLKNRTYNDTVYNEIDTFYEPKEDAPGGQFNFD